MSNNCSVFTYGDYDHDEIVLCRCPKCKGFLPRDFPIVEGEQWQCKKCGSVLEIIVDVDPEEKAYYLEQFQGILYQLGLEQIPPFDPAEGDYFNGRICKVPDYAVKIEVVDWDLKRRMDKELFSTKKNTGTRVFGDGFTRTVWKDKKGPFIEIHPLGRIDEDTEIWKSLVKGKISE